MTTIFYTVVQLQVDLQELQAEGQAKVSAVADCRTQLEEVKTAIAAREQELAALAPEYAQHVDKLSKLESEFDSTSQRLETLYGKQGRGMQFTSKKDRNAFLQEQIESLQAQFLSKQALLERLSTELSSEEKSLMQEDAKQKAGEQTTHDHNANLDELSAKAKVLLNKRNTAQEARKTAWKEAESVQESMQEVTTELERGQHALNASLPRHVSQGLACVERIAIDKGMVASGAYKGPVIDNFTLRNEAFRLAGTIPLLLQAFFNHSHSNVIYFYCS